MITILCKLFILMERLKGKRSPLFRAYNSIMTVKRPAKAKLRTRKLPLFSTFSMRTLKQKWEDL